MRLAQLAVGVASFVPGLERLLRRPTGGSNSARYCYSLWLRHAVQCYAAGVWRRPNVVAELGPGDSLGTGVVALLCGANRYVALDAVQHSSVAANLAMLDEILELVRNRAPIPGDEEFPDMWPRLASYDFPDHVFPFAELKIAAADERAAEIRRSLETTDSRTSLIRYAAPWQDNGVVEPHSVDMLFSQAVLEHVEGLPAAYDTMGLWLAREGFMSHTVDFKCHNLADEWNGHLAYSDFAWAALKGRRPYLLNRVTPAEHLDLLRRAGFAIVRAERALRSDGLPATRLAARYRGICASDRDTSDLYFNAISGSNSAHDANSSRAESR